MTISSIKWIFIYDFGSEIINKIDDLLLQKYSSHYTVMLSMCGLQPDKQGVIINFRNNPLFAIQPICDQEYKLEVNTCRELDTDDIILAWEIKQIMYKEYKIATEQHERARNKV